jgi:hypothetical protein
LYRTLPLFFGTRLSRKSTNVVVFPFAFHIAVHQPLKPLWCRLLLCDYEPSRPSTVLCFMSLLSASGEFVSEFPSPRVFFLASFHRLGWPNQESGSWGILGPPTTSRWQPFGSK